MIEPEVDYDGDVDGHIVETKTVATTVVSALSDDQPQVRTATIGIGD